MIPSPPLTEVQRAELEERAYEIRRLTIGLDSAVAEVLSEQIPTRGMASASEAPRFEDNLTHHNMRAPDAAWAAEDVLAIRKLASHPPIEWQQAT